MAVAAIKRRRSTPSPAGTAEGAAAARGSSSTPVAAGTAAVAVVVAARGVAVLRRRLLLLGLAEAVRPLLELRRRRPRRLLLLGVPTVDDGDCSGNGDAGLERRWRRQVAKVEARPRRRHSGVL